MTDRRAAEIDEAWGDYRTWALTSRGLAGRGELVRAWMVRATFAAVLLGPLAQYLGLFKVSPVVTSTVTWVGSLVVTVVAFFNEKILGPEKDTPWLRARALAEKIKGETYRFIMKTPPFEDPAETALTERVNGMVEKLRGIAPVEITGEEKRDRRPAYTLDGDAYFRERVIDQINYFRIRRDENQKIVARYKLLGWFFGGVAALLVLPSPAAVKFFQGVSYQNLVALSASVASGVSGFLVATLSAGRYKYLAESYEAARTDLDALRAIWDTSRKSPERLADLVSRAEDILARENAGWYEALARPPG